MVYFKFRKLEALFQTINYWSGENNVSTSRKIVFEKDIFLSSQTFSHFYFCPISSDAFDVSFNKEMNHIKMLCYRVLTYWGGRQNRSPGHVWECHWATARSSAWRICWCTVTHLSYISQALITIIFLLGNKLLCCNIMIYLVPRDSTFLFQLLVC